MSVRGEERGMYAVVAQVSIESGREDEAVAYLHSDVVPRVKQAPGVVAGYWLRAVRDPVKEEPRAVVGSRITFERAQPPAAVRPGPVPQDELVAVAAARQSSRHERDVRTDGVLRHDEAPPRGEHGVGPR